MYDPSSREFYVEFYWLWQRVYLHLQPYWNLPSPEEVKLKFMPLFLQMDRDERVETYVRMQRILGEGDKDLQDILLAIPWQKLEDCGERPTPDSERGSDSSPCRGSD